MRGSGTENKHQNVIAYLNKRVLFNSYLYSLYRLVCRCNSKVSQGIKQLSIVNDHAFSDLYCTSRKQFGLNQPIALVPIASIAKASSNDNKRDIPSTPKVSPVKTVAASNSQCSPTSSVVSSTSSVVTTPSSDPGSPGSLYQEVMSESGYQFPNSSSLPTFEEALADTSFYADQLSQSQQLQHPYQGSMEWYCQQYNQQYPNQYPKVDPGYSSYPQQQREQDLDILNELIGSGGPDPFQTASSSPSSSCSSASGYYTHNPPSYH